MILGNEQMRKRKRWRDQVKKVEIIGNEKKQFLFVFYDFGYALDYMLIFVQSHKTLLFDNLY